MATIPFEERKTPWRGILDVATGRYPAFVFGGRLGRLVPMFHFHEVSADYLEPHLRYLAENGYRTITSDAVTRFARDGVDPGPGAVALGFDDAWSSVWTVAAPLLKRYGMQAVTYAIPGLVADADATRPTVADGAVDPHLADASAQPYATWPELKALHDGGTIDVQAHTCSHAMVFCDDEVTDFVTPGFAPHPLLRPAIGLGDRPRLLTREDLGAPLYAMRSRMSDARRYLDSEDARRACRDRIDAVGADAFFKRPGWRDELRDVAACYRGRFETDDERRAAIRSELVRAREMLTQRLDSRAVRQVCLPWAVMGTLTESLLAEAGYESAVADRLHGRRAVCRRQNPWRLMRLKHRFIFTLPGKGRQAFFKAGKR